MLQLRPPQQLLLKACLLTGETAVESGKNWFQQVDIDRLESSSTCLLSILYRNLSQEQFQHPELPRLKGIFRRHWTYNQVLLKTVIPWLQQLQSEGRGIIIFGDLAWFTEAENARKYRPSVGLNWLVSDFCLDRDLQQSGWEMTTKTEALQIWRQPQKPSLSLHKHLYQALPQSYTDRQVRENSIVTKVGGIKVRCLSPTDRLLFICQQTMKRRGNYRLLGLVDSYNLLQTEAIDWINLVQQAQRYERIIPLRTVLEFSSSYLGVDFPNWVLPSLRKMPISDYELLSYDLRQENFSLRVKGLLLRQLRVYQSWISTENS
ncbi:MAG: nucleotidyltransferase family protein [Oscillatoria sp. PMC 1068.18]|nr:nucleotidyltransferase family protein [Oscillatoria sp. PMC 1076.18]MEC4988172.1 nucleotidyltransferase family protein [Oscillatoria sp. PMC 1068.18]